MKSACFKFKCHTQLKNTCCWDEVVVNETGLYQRWSNATKFVNTKLTIIALEQFS